MTMKLICTNCNQASHMLALSFQDLYQRTRTCGRCLVRDGQDAQTVVLDGYWLMGLSDDGRTKIRLTQDAARVLIALDLGANAPASTPDPTPAPASDPTPAPAAVPDPAPAPLVPPMAPLFPPAPPEPAHA